MEFGTLKIGNGNLENKGMLEICQPRTILHQKHTLQSVRWGYAGGIFWQGIHIATNWARRQNTYKSDSVTIVALNSAQVADRSDPDSVP